MQNKKPTLELRFDQFRSIPIEQPSAPVAMPVPAPAPQHRMPGPPRSAQMDHMQSEAAGTLRISPQQMFIFSAGDLEDRGTIGTGNYGIVHKMAHKESGQVMAVKRIRYAGSTVSERERQQLLMESEVVKKSDDCSNIVKFYGALYTEGECWICMELLDISSDKFYKLVHHHLNEKLEEFFLGKLIVTTVSALNYLKEKLNIIHRDVKPSNILLSRSGSIKLCDFGIAGKLIDSLAKTREAGCRPYMAPERIDPTKVTQKYGVRSDVWSLGITLYELATGTFPYRRFDSVFDQLEMVVEGPAPRLDNSDCSFSEPFVIFVNGCLTKDERNRPKYDQLMVHPFYQAYAKARVDVAGYISNKLDRMPANFLADEIGFSSSE